MASYVNKSSQTLIEGLVHDPAPLPVPLVRRISADTTTTTPPDDMMAINQIQRPAEGVPSITMSKMENPNVSPVLFLRKKTRPRLEARISMPEVARFDPNNPCFPPMSEAVMSPLPAANRLHAGHTPIVPRAQSPFHEFGDDDDDDIQEQGDQSLSGPLTLPPQPGDGTEDRISLLVLEAELKRVAVEQGRLSKHSTNEEFPLEPDTPPSRKGSTDEGVEIVDGVLLKRPRKNFGAPFGQA